MKIYRFFWVTMLLASVTIGVCSCSDDDDDDGGKVPASTGILDEETGLRVKSACGYDYSYDDNGRLSSISDKYANYCKFYYNSNKIEISDDGDEINFNVKYNGNGTISSLEGTSVYDDSYDHSESTQSISFSYDGNGHLTKISGTVKENGRDNMGYKWWDNYKINFLFTWNKNLLQKVVCIEDGEEEEGTYVYEDTYTFLYNDNALTNYANKYLQYGSFAEDYLSTVLSMFCYVGLLGNGPEYLPSGLDEETYEEWTEDGEKKDYKDSDSKSYRYTFNSNGTIATSGSYKYSYGYVNDGNDNNSSRRAAFVDEATGSNTLDGHKLFSLFKSHKNRHHQR